MKTEDIFPDSIISDQSEIKEYVNVLMLKGKHSLKFQAPDRLPYHLFLIVKSGEMRIYNETSCRTIGRNQFLSVPVWTGITGVEFSETFSGMAVGASPKLIFDLFWNGVHFSTHFRYIIYSFIYSTELSAQERATALSDMREILETAKSDFHHYRNERIYALFYLFFTDIAGMIWRKDGKGEHNREQTLSRTEEHLKRFMSIMEENVEKESSPAFYARKMCISSQYLSKIIKNATKLTTGEFLSMVRYEIAARALLNIESSIQQISDRMGFCDQSAFGKFFRKHSGMSPLEYRKKSAGKRHSSFIAEKNA